MIRWLLLILAISLHLCAYSATVQTGQFTAVYTERSPLSQMKSFRLQQRITMDDYHLADESFQVFVPKRYSPKKPPGLLVWISSGPQGNPLPDWYSVFEQSNLIFIMPNNAGNGRKPNWHRVGLALDAVSNICTRYIVDRQRIYIGGPSGGGNQVGPAALYHPDVFTGCLLMLCYPRFREVKIQNLSLSASFPPPPDYFLMLAQKKLRIVFLAGEKDTWMPRERVKATAEYGYQDFAFHPVYFEVPNLDHNVPHAPWVKKCLAALDAPLAKSVKESQRAKRK